MLILAPFGSDTGKSSLVMKLLNFIKFEHTVFSLPLLFSGAWLGSGGAMPELKVLILIFLAGAGGRSDGDVQLHDHRC